jgi:hypothetical protein
LPGKTEPCLEKQSLAWKNRALPGKTEPCLKKRSLVWENRALSGETEPCLEKQSLTSKKSGNPGCPGLPPVDYSITDR